MRYFVKKSKPSKKGLYLQIYKTNYVPGKGNQNKSYKVIGYASDLIASGIPDPVAYAQNLVDELNSNLPNRKEMKIGDISSSKNLGYFLIKSMIDYLDFDYILKLMSSNMKFHFNLSDFVRSMIYAQIVNPGSKHKAFEKVMPNIYGTESFSYDQILDTINYIGNDYQKFVELLNISIQKKWKRNTSNAYFDCTNYYFEIDLPKEDRQFGPSKEERHLPIIGQALLLDENQIPIGMSLYPGNESEKTKIRESIENLKQRFDIDSRIVQVADKGLNCARNIYAASKEANDGYIFSKSVHGKNLSKQEKQWVLLENENNIWNEVKDSNGKLIYKYKECIDTFKYKFTNEEGKCVEFDVKEKRVVSYNPSLARKQKAQIQKQIDKAISISSLKQASKEEYGDSIKYVNFTSIDKEGEVVKSIPSLNQEKIDEDLSFAGYNLLVTSEINKSAQDIYNTYHGLWRIEESFRVMKTYLEARPVYLQNKESIYGHFTICYMALTILRLIELKVFNDELPIGQIIEFIRNYNITETLEGSFINNATKSNTLSIIQKRYGLSKLDNIQLRKKDVENILTSELFFD
ncbi:MAG: IS1634 family transposase [Bacilli bacterium]